MDLASEKAARKFFKWKPIVGDGVEVTDAVRELFEKFGIDENDLRDNSTTERPDTDSANS